MGIFEQFPYTNFHDLNLDWILHTIRSMDKKLDEFVASNVLSYADPIQWDIETQYAKNTVVVDPKTGTAYMSINPVPVGQLLTNKYYWQPIFNYDEIVNTLKKQIAAVQADQHDIIHVAVGYGDLVWVANKLYRLTKSLDAGSKITENENAVPVTVEDAIINIDTTKNITRNTEGTITDTAGTITRNAENITDIANNAMSVSGKTITNAAADSITNSSTNITNTATGDVSVSGKNITDTAGDTFTRNAVTITDSATGDVSVSGKNITETASAEIARNAATITDTATNIETNTNNKTESVTGTETLTKNIVNETVNNLTLVGKNELKFKSDSLVLDSNGEPIKLGMNVTDDLYYGTLKVREANGNVREIMVKNNGTPNLARSFNNYILVGDSYAQGWTPDGSVTGWPELLHQLLKGNLYASVTQGGAGLSDKMTGIYNLTTRISELANSDNVDSIICCCGKNDINSGELVNGINNGIKNFVDTCHQKFKNAKVYIGFIGWDLNKLPGWTVGKSLDLKNGIAEYERVTSDYTYIKTDFIMRQRSYLSSDGVHPNQAGQNALAYGIKCALYGGIPSYTKPFILHTYPDANGGGIYQIKENFVGGITFLQFTPAPSIQYHGTDENVTFDNYELTVIKNVELDYIIPSGYNLTTMQAKILLQTKDETYYTLDVPAYFKSNSDGTYDLVINITAVSHAGNSWAGGIIKYLVIYSSIVVANPLT